VDATAILYNTLRPSQEQLAVAAEIAPEALSGDKLFPTLIEHHHPGYLHGFRCREGCSRECASSLPRQRRPDMQIHHPTLPVRIRDHRLGKHKEEETPTMFLQRSSARRPTTIHLAQRDSSRFLQN
jgi:hypothetical protein